MSDTLHTRIANIIAKHGRVTKPMVDEVVELVERELTKVTRHNVHVDELIQEQEKLQEAVRTIMAFAERDNGE